ncbi:MAG: hypothetical protein DI537_23855 [Stutzerimonas stutzeri]|nr:MAG: hypothetical protein DI537_23855 [Stutzerimonas stutzeri]
MTAAREPISGSAFMLAAIDAVEQQARVIMHREERAARRGEVVNREMVEHAAWLTAAAEMLATLKTDGDIAVANGKKPFLVIKAISAGRSAYEQIERGPAREAA